jgi:hypothetical protein
MSILVRYPASNVSKDTYDKVHKTLTDAGEWPADGCELHVAFGADDDLRVSEVWESQEKLEAFGATLQPRLEEAGVQLSGEPEILAVHQVERF